MPVNSLVVQENKNMELYKLYSKEFMVTYFVFQDKCPLHHENNYGDDKNKGHAIAILLKSIISSQNPL